MTLRSHAMPTCSPALFLAACAGVGVPWSPCPTASATVVNAEFAPDGSSYKYRIARMPDLTQMRSTLPNNGGYYCIPTSSMDLFCYAAANGFPWMSPGHANWRSQARYDEATAAITQLAGLMDTSATTGTTGAGTVDGFSAWVEDAESFAWKVRFRTAAFPLTLEDAAKPACAGWLVAITRGEYTVNGTYQGYPLLTRVSGHGLALSGAVKNSEKYEVVYRNPAEYRTDLTIQPPFTNTTVDVQDITVALGESASEIYTVTALEYTPGDAKMYVLDGFRALRPTFALTIEPSSEADPKVKIKLLAPSGFVGSLDLLKPSIALPLGIDALDVALHPDLTCAYVITQAVGEPSQLQVLDLFSGALTPTSAPSGLTRLCVSGLDAVYAIDENTLYALSPTGAVLETDASIATPTAVAYDDVANEVIVLSVPERKIVRLGGVTNPSFTAFTFDIPDSVPLEGDASIASSPQSDAMWFCSDGSDDLFVLDDSTGTYEVAPVSVAAVQSPEAICTNAIGNLFVSCVAGVRELYQNLDGVWLADFASPFDGLDASNRFCVVASNANYDPTVHTPELGWVDTDATMLPDLGTPVPDCVADINLDDVVDGGDLGLLVADWGPAPATGSDADLNADGVVDGADIGALLAAWGACPGVGG